MSDNTQWLTKDERLQLHSMKEDYLEMLHQNVEMRDENPSLWHTIVDQWEAIQFRLEQDEHEKIMSTATITVGE